MRKTARTSFYRNLELRRCLLASAPLMTAVLAAQGLEAVTYPATNVATLRTAIDSANAGTTNDIVTVAPGTYVLSGAALENGNASGDLDIVKAQGTLMITGAGVGNTIIDANFLDRVFHINAVSGITVTIQDLTIRNGQVSDNGTSTGQARGGGILLQSGNLTLVNVDILDCSASGPNGVNGGNGGVGQPGTSGTPGQSALGGGIYQAGGTLQVTGCTLDANTALGGNGGNGGAGGAHTTSSLANGGAGGDGAAAGGAFGGGIYAGGGTLNLVASSISNSIATAGNGGIGGPGGGAYFQGGDGGIGADGGTAHGGAIMQASGVTLTITDSTLASNSALAGDGGSGGSGGGITALTGGSGAYGGDGGSGQGGAVYTAGGSITLTNSTVSGNAVAAGDGADGGNGGSGFVTMSLSGFAGDGGDAGWGGNARGGGLMVAGGNLVIYNSTIANNSTGAAGTAGLAGAGGTPGTGGVVGASGVAGVASGGGADQGGGTVNADSTIFADNTAPSGPDFAGNITAGASLFETNPTGTLTAGTGTNIVGTDPMLGVLQINGGTTQTHSLLIGSVARDAGSNPLTLTNDQRGGGFNRSIGAQTDMGAFETPGAGVMTPAPTVSSPAAPTVVNAPNHAIQGTAFFNSLVRVYTDNNNDGSIAGETLVGSLQLSNGDTVYSITVTLAQNADNDFLVTADSGYELESAPVDVPTITEDSTPPAGTTVTDPAAPLNSTGNSYNVQGGCEADSLIRLYIDYNNNGAIDGADSEVANFQVTGGATTYSVTAPITLSTTNNFVVTASDAVGNESGPVNVPTITETTPPAISPPTISDPTAPVSVDAASYPVSGTAQADSLVRIYRDNNNDGFINQTDSVVASVQLTGGATSFSIPTPLQQAAANNFLATADDGAGNESLPTDIPTITDTNTAPSPGDDESGNSGCAVHNQSGWDWLFGGLIASLLIVMRRGAGRRTD